MGKDTMDMKMAYTRCEMLMDLWKTSLSYPEVLVVMAVFDYKSALQELQAFNRLVGPACGMAVPEAAANKKWILPSPRDPALANGQQEERSLDVSENPLLEYQLTTIEARAADLGLSLDAPAVRSLIGHEKRVLLMRMLESLRTTVKRHC